MALEDIPASAREICAKIDAKVSQYPHRIYSVDIALDHDGTWKIIELNSQPGLGMDDYNDGELGKKLFEGGGGVVDGGGERISISTQTIVVLHRNRSNRCTNDFHKIT